MVDKTPEQIALERIQEAKDNKYEILDLSYINLHTFPSEIGHLG